MSGLLDSKERIMDTIVTLEGRRQIADGNLKIEYVSFTDGATFYSLDAISGSADVTNRLYFEQGHLPQDQITFEADDSGKLKPFKNSQGIQVLGGTIPVPATVTSVLFSGSQINAYKFLTGSAFASTAESLLASSVDNFKKLYVIGTKDVLFLEEESTKLSKQTVSFKVTENNPLKPNKKVRSLDFLPSIYNDEKFTNVKNFRYLPPINRIYDKFVNRKDPEVITDNSIGNYPKLTRDTRGFFGKLTDKYGFEELNNELISLEDKGFKETIYFDSTSLANKLFSQVFEITGDSLQKLDVLEFGTFKHENKIKQVFFVGKVFLDQYENHTFVKIFTLIFE